MTRSSRLLGWLALWGDLRFAVRSLRRNPGLIATAAGALLLGVVVNGAVFTVTNALLFEAPPGIQNPELVHRVVIATRPSGKPIDINAVGLSDLRDFQEALGADGQVAGFQMRRHRPGRTANETVNITFATGSYFDVLGVRLAAGDVDWARDDDRLADPARAVISYALWQRWGRRPDIVGQTITVDSLTWRVVGVAPSGFQGVDNDRADLWVPVSAMERIANRLNGGSEAARNPTSSGFWANDHHKQMLIPLVRLRRDISERAISDRLTRSYRMSTPTRRASSADTLATVRAPSIIAARAEQLMQRTRMGRGFLSTLLFMSGIVFALCVINCASLLLLRAQRRRHEIGVRLALGVSKPRLAAQMAMETAFLGVCAGSISLIGVWWGARALRTVLIPDIEWAAPGISPLVAFGVVAMGIVAALIAAIAPVAAAVSHSPSEVLVDRPSGRRHPLFANKLMVAHVALSTVLLLFAGGFVRSHHQALHVNVGFAADRLVNVTVTGVPLSSAEPILKSLAARVGQLPGVAGVSIAAGELLHGAGLGATYPVRMSSGDSVPFDLANRTTFNAVDDRFFDVSGIRILQGRPLTAVDRAGSGPVVVVSQAMAQRYWGAGNPIGDCLVLVVEGGVCARVVGVAADTRQSLRGDPPVRLYLPQAQRRSFIGNTLLVRMQTDLSGRQLRMIRDVIRADLNAVGATATVTPSLDGLRSELQPLLTMASLLSALGVVGVILAVLGLYGTLSYEVRMRTREFGVRLALGASPLRLTAQCALASAYTVATGALIGLCVAYPATARLSAALLYETTPFDASIVAGVSGTLLLAALVASAVPALRAGRTDPLSAIRTT